MASSCASQSLARLGAGRRQVAAAARPPRSSPCSCGMGGRREQDRNTAHRRRTTPRLTPVHLRPAIGGVRPQARASGPGELRATGVYTGVRELPIFPLNMVALPAATVYLNIFEARYRVLFNTLLAGSDDLEEGLVNPDSPFCGTREFGMCLVDQNGGLSAIGTLLRIKAHEHMPDGQIQIENLGMERFRILDVKQERPVLICDVEFLESGEDDDNADLQQLREQVADLSRNTLRLSYKMGKVDTSESSWDLPEFNELSPQDLSFWIAYNFMQDNFSKQAMLEINSTRQRLEEEAELLQKNLSYLSAASALEGAFSDSSPPSSDQQP